MENHQKSRVSTKTSRRYQITIKTTRSLILRDSKEIIPTARMGLAVVIAKMDPAKNQKKIINLKNLNSIGKIRTKILRTSRKIQKRMNRNQNKNQPINITSITNIIQRQAMKNQKRKIKMIWQLKVATIQQIQQTNRIRRPLVV